MVMVNHLIALAILSYLPENNNLEGDQVTETKH